MIETAAILGLSALLAYREWGARLDRREAAAERAEALAERSREVKALAELAAKERRELYQRIQAPEIAVAEAVRESRPKRPPRRPIAADDDARFAAVAEGGESA